METSLSSSINSVQPSDYEEAEPAFNSHANSMFNSFLEMQHRVGQKIKAQQLADFNYPLPLKGFTYDPSKLLGSDMGTNGTSQGHKVMGQHLNIDITKHHENISILQDHGDWPRVITCIVPAGQNTKQDLQCKTGQEANNHNPPAVQDEICYTNLSKSA
ncbi:hypothetical protein KIW84_033686 [Lathyrus oleraceus]|uniref:Uncharacterized protein n=1 Tax=Pisum sativum TaxID=3888 RepID=A0A9D4XWF1_PEA|nr:hypothetical protein KIW84_033686 [Pisum sativum]